MNREELLKELSNYRILPLHGINLNELTDEQLEAKLKLYESMFSDESWEE